MNDQDRAEKLRQAKIKHGREFRTNELVKRITPPSFALKEIISKAPKQAKVMTIRKNEK